MRHSLLFITSGAEGARRTFRQGRADWAQGLPVVLEKHGLLDVTVASPERLLAGDGHAGPVLVSDLPEEAWTGEFIGALAALDVPVLCGGPVPPSARAAFGISALTGTDEPVGSIFVTDEEVWEQAQAYGMAPGTRFAPDTVSPVPLAEEQHWRRFPEIGIDDAHAAAWTSWTPRIERWSVDADATVLAEWAAGQTSVPPSPASVPPSPAVVRRGGLMACAFPLFAILGYTHTCTPWDPGEHRSSMRMIGLETLVLSLIDCMAMATGSPRWRVMPWPVGKSWALSVRHDVDRPFDMASAAEMLARHQRAGTKATWYWRASHLTRPKRWREKRAARQALRRVARTPGHEIAHHTEELWGGGEAERKAIARASGVTPVGTCAHGSANCFRFQGAPNILWAERQRLRYTELIQHGHYHPFRFLMLGSDGAVEPTADVICLPHHQSLDRGMRGDTHTEHILEVLPTWLGISGLLQVMNHPDINREPLFSLLDKLPTDGRWDCTAEEAIDWWRRTHVAGELSVRTLGDGGVEVWSRTGVRGLVLEALEPDGERSTHAISLAPGERSVLEVKPAQALRRPASAK